MTRCTAQLNILMIRRYNFIFPHCTHCGKFGKDGGTGLWLRAQALGESQLCHCQPQVERTVVPTPEGRCRGSKGDIRKFWAWPAHRGTPWVATLTTIG